MLDSLIAQKLIERAKEFINYNINIMNELGIIVASSNPSRIGTFHEIAYRIINGDHKAIETRQSDDLLGVKEGINMALMFKKDIIGVIGITGNPDEVRPLAQLLKLSVETMFEYESQQMLLMRQQSLYGQFIGGLTSGNVSDEFLLSFAKENKISNQAPRIPILICYSQKVDREIVLAQIKKGKNLSSQDIAAALSDDSFIVYKAFENMTHSKISNEYKNIILDYLNQIITYNKENNLEAKIYIGSFHVKIKNCHIGYRHCLWLKKSGIPHQTALFFYDHIGEYMNQFIPTIELHEIFNFFSNSLDKEFINSISEITENLISSNYNLTISSQNLFIHKNTMIYRLNKIKEHFNIDPLQSSSDRKFLEYLCQYVEYLKQSEEPALNVQKAGPLRVDESPAASWNRMP